MIRPCVLPKVDKVTTVGVSRTTIFLGVGGVSYNWQITQYEMFQNLHYLEKQRLIVDDVVQSVGWTQSIITPQHLRVNVPLPLDFDRDTMKFDVQEPTTKELIMLEICWIYRQ